MSETPNQPLATFSEIESLFSIFPEGDEDSAATVKANLPEQSGVLGDYAEWLARWQGKTKPDLRHARVALFAATQLPDPKIAETQKLVERALKGELLINKLCQTMDMDLRVYELDVENPAADPASGNAMNEEDCARAIAYGMMAVEPGIQLLCIGDLSLNKFAPGHSQQSLLESLRCFGGYDSAAIFGAILAARLAQVPVVLSGAVAVFTYEAARNYDENLVAHCMLRTGNGLTSDTRCHGAEFVQTLRLAAGLLT